MQETSRRKLVIKNRVEGLIEQAVVQTDMDKLALGWVRMSEELRKKGILVSHGGVRSIWLRHDMETFRVAQDSYYRIHQRGGTYLPKDCHRHLFQDRFRQKLYDRKNALVAADMLNDRVVPFFGQRDLKLMRMHENFP